MLAKMFSVLVGQETYWLPISWEVEIENYNSSITMSIKEFKMIRNTNLSYLSFTLKDFLPFKSRLKYQKNLFQEAFEIDITMFQCDMIRIKVYWPFPCFHHVVIEHVFCLICDQGRYLYAWDQIVWLMLFSFFISNHLLNKFLGVSCTLAILSKPDYGFFLPFSYFSLVFSLAGSISMVVLMTSGLG